MKYNLLYIAHSFKTLINILRIVTIRINASKKGHKIVKKNKNEFE